MMQRSAVRLTCLLALLLTAAQLGAAEVDASLSRERVAAGEPVFLTLSASGTTPIRADLTPLETAFQVLDRANVSDISEINGRRQERQSLRLTLLPRREGLLTVPSLRVNDGETPPLAIEVTTAESLPLAGAAPTTGRGSPTAAAPQFAQTIEVEASARPQRVVVGQQVIIRVVVSGDGRLPPGRLIEPGVGQADVLPLGEERRFSPAVNASASAGRSEYERRYAFFPHHAGTLEIPPLRFSAWQPGADTPTEYASSSLRIEVAAAPARPPGIGPEMPWLPASALSLTEAGATTVRLAPGQVIERMLTLKAVGLRAEHLPAIPLAVPFQLRALDDPPRLWNERGPDGVTGYRTERVTISANEPGTYRLPETVVTWWNVGTDQWEQASSPEWQLDVAALDSASRRPAPDWRRQQSSDNGPGSLSPDDDSTPATDSKPWPIEHWPWLLGAFGAALVALLAWGRLRTARRRNGSGPPSSPSARYKPLGPSQAAEGGAGTADPTEMSPCNEALVKVEAAYRAANAASARQALLDWGAVMWPEQPPGNLWQLSLRLPEPVAGDVQQLDKAFFSPTPIEWHAASVPKRLAEFIEAARESHPSA